MPKKDKDESFAEAGVIDFEIPSLQEAWPVVAVSSIVVTAGIFMLIPFTQLLEGLGKKILPW